MLMNVSLWLWLAVIAVIAAILAIDLFAPLKSSFPPDLRSAHPVAAVPPHCPQNDVTGEMTTGEDTHGCDYFTSLFLLPQLCNNTCQTA